MTWIESKKLQYPFAVVISDSALRAEIVWKEGTTGWRCMKCGHLLSKGEDGLSYCNGCGDTCSPIVVLKDYDV